MRLAVAVLVGTAAGAVAATQPIADTDLFWHLATARETLAHGFVHTDVFSWTVRGAPVSIDQWLGQVVLYGAYLALDWRGIAIVRVVAVVALMSLVVLSATQRRTGRPLVTVIAALPAFVLTRVLWVDRPELLGLVCFAAVLLLLRRGRGGTAGGGPSGSGERGNLAALLGVAPLIAFWANVHGSFALGAVLALIVCAEGALRDPARRRAYLFTAVAVLVATVCTPAGLGTWTAPGLHFLSPPREIQEWGLIDIRTPLGIAYAATLALVIACALRGPRVPLRELVVLVPVAFLSLTAARQAPLLAIAAAPLFAERTTTLAEWLVGRAGTTEGPRARGATERRDARRTAERLRGSALPRRREGFGVAAVIAASGALFIAALAIAPAALDERTYPVAALESLPKGDGTLARYEWGGWLIWRAPDTPVFVDGRLTPYAGGVLDDYRHIITAAPGWEEAIARRGVRTLLVTPADPVAVRALERGWRPLASSSDFVLIAVP